MSGDAKLARGVDKVGTAADCTITNTTGRSHHRRLHTTALSGQYLRTNLAFDHYCFFSVHR